eukprot:scaffold3679_cov128-Skeletonema_menzelii.AAC.2
MELLTVIAIEDSRGAATRQQCILSAAEEGATTQRLGPAAWDHGRTRVDFGIILGPARHTFGLVSDINLN